MFLGALMVAVDISNLTSAKTKIAAITDAAALAGANSHGKANREEIVTAFLLANASEMLPAKMIGTPVIDFGDNEKEVSVYIDTSIPMTFSGVLGIKNKNVGYESVAIYPNNMDPLTIAFALDVSGSMGETTTDGEIKLDALKDATSLMFDTIENKVGDPYLIEDKVRTGLSTFNGSLSVTHDMSWGFDEIEDAIDKLEDGGWTNTHAALVNAHNQILTDRLFRVADDPEIDLNSLDEFVIFMTDGANTAGDPFQLDEDSYQACIAMREDGIEVFSIAFTAPEEGQLLLMDCASWDDLTIDINSGRAEHVNKKCRKDNNGNGPGNNNGNGNGANNNNGNKNGHTKAKCDKDYDLEKEAHYYDAENAQTFNEIFETIALKINESAIRII